MPRLTKDEVSTAAQLAGVPPALALAIWQKERKGGVGEFKVTPKMFKQYATGSINDPVDNMHAGLAIIAEGLRQSGGDWEEAAKFYYGGSSPDVLSRARQFESELGTEEIEPPAEMPMEMGNASNIPGYTGPMNSNVTPYDSFDQETNQMGSANYELDRYIRRLVDEEFDNGRPVRT